MVKKKITRNVYVTMTLPYTKKFTITKEVDWKYKEILKEDEMDEDEYDEEQYFEDEFQEEFEDEAKDLMDNHLNSDFTESDINWDESEITEVEVEEE